MEHPVLHSPDHSQMSSHLLLLQTWSAAHSVPHCPQLNASIVVSVQISSHSSLQASVQRPRAQNLSPWQAKRQAPQLLGSVYVFTQARLQFCRPSSQLSLHTPKEQTSVLLHGRSQTPQWLGLDFRSTHWSPHCIWSLGQPGFFFEAGSSVPQAVVARINAVDASVQSVRRVEKCCW